MSSSRKRVTAVGALLIGFGPGAANACDDPSEASKPSIVISLKPLLACRTEQWHPQRDAADAACLKILTRQLERLLPQSSACTHLRGNWGLKEAVRAVQAALPGHRYVFRTDVKSYYASINHHRLLDQLAEHVKDRDTLNVLWQYMRRTVEFGGTFREITRGIPAGCSLSPLMGAFHLHELDVEMSTRHRGCFYIRYMDDILVLAPSRWRLRRGIAAIKQHLGRLGLELHPDKTSIGPIARGFDFLGYQHDRTGLRLSKVTLARHQEKLTRLYERYQRRLRAHRKALVGQSTIPRPDTDPARAYLYPRPQITSHEDIIQRLEVYKRRFNAWAQGGLNTCEIG